MQSKKFKEWNQEYSKNYENSICCYRNREAGWNARQEEVDKLKNEIKHLKSDKLAEFDISDSSIGKAWVTEYDHLYKLCIRMKKPHTIKATQDEMPPIGSRMSITEAIEKGVQESHHIIGTFHVEDLVILKRAIDLKLGY